MISTNLDFIPGVKAINKATLMLKKKVSMIFFLSEYCDLNNCIPNSTITKKTMFNFANNKKEITIKNNIYTNSKYFFSLITDSKDWIQHKIRIVV
jgi:hypothetical protein